MKGPVSESATQIESVGQAVREQSDEHVPPVAAVSQMRSFESWQDVAVVQAFPVSVHDGISPQTPILSVTGRQLKPSVPQ